MKHILTLIAIIITGISMSTHAYAGKTLSYYDGETELEGYYVSTDTMAEIGAPTVLIVHQWTGLGEYEKQRARMLADQGYKVFAIDMYGKGIRPDIIKPAATESSKYKDDPELARKRLKAALDFVKKFSNSDKIGIMGYCFGGTMALEMARMGADIDAAVSFHGGLGSKAPVTEKDVIKASILVHHGDADPFVPAKEVDGFVKEMRSSGADWQFIRYADAQHSFTEVEADTNGIDGTAYNKLADERSWASTLQFFDETLKN